MQGHRGAGPDERVQRRLATYVTPFTGGPVLRPASAVDQRTAEPRHGGPWSGALVALAAGLVMAVVAVLLGLALLAQFLS
jgi:hypothetical protein